jgi:hypothetical protein
MITLDDDDLVAVTSVEELGGNEPLMKVIDMLDVQIQAMAELDMKSDDAFSQPARDLSLNGKMTGET